MAEKKVPDRYEGAASKKQERYPVPGHDGCWVELLRLSAGEENERLDVSMSFEPGDSKADKGKAFLSTAKARRYDFLHCIVDHNIDMNGKPADFRIKSHVDGLDAELAEAIGSLIDAHNGRKEAESTDPSLQVT